MANRYNLAPNEEAQTARYNESTEKLAGAKPTSLGDRLKGTAVTAVDEFMFSTPTLINTAFYGTLGLPESIMKKMSGENREEGFGVFLDPYKDAYNEASQFWRGNREAAGPYGELTAAVLGMLTPGGPAKAIDKTLEGGISLVDKVAPKAGDKLKRMFTSGMAGGTTAALQGYLQGETSFEDALFNGAFGGAFGAGMQRLMGEGGMDLDKKRYGVLGSVLNDLKDSGVDMSRTLNLKEIAKAVEEGKFAHTTDGGDPTMLTTQLGGAPLYKQWQKFTDSIADLSFGTTATKDLQTAEAEQASRMFNDYLTDIQIAVNQVNDQAKTTFDTAVGAPTSRARAIEAATPDLTKAKEVYDSMQRTEPYPDGRKPYGVNPVDPQLILHDVSTKLLSDINRTDIEQLKPAQRKMYNKLKNLLRRVEEQDNAMGVVNKPATGRTDREDIFPETQLWQLLDARQQFADMLSPASAIADGIKPTEHRAGVQILRELDKSIDNLAANEYGTAKGDFSKQKQIRDMFDFGVAAVVDNNNLVDDKNFTANYKEYVNNVIEGITDPDLKKVVSDGYKFGLSSQAGKHGFHKAMANLVGEQGELLMNSDFFKGKGDNFDLMKSMLGEDGTQTLIRLYNDGIMTEGYTDLLYDTLVAKGADDKLARKIAGSPAARSVLQLDQQTAYAEMRETSKSLIKKLVHPKDQKKAEAALMLMTATGKELEDMLTIGLEEAVGGFPSIIGTRAGAVSGEVFSTGIEAGTDAGEGAQSIADYLKSMGGDDEPTKKDRPNLVPQ